MKDFAKYLYKSTKYRHCRKSYINERILTDGGMCEICGDAVGYIVHHKITLTPDNIRDPEIVYGHGNMMYVCKACHDKFPDHFDDAGRAAKFGSDGQPNPPIKNNIPPPWEPVAGVAWKNARLTQSTPSPKIKNGWEIKDK